MNTAMRFITSAATLALLGLAAQQALAFGGTQSATAKGVQVPNNVPGNLGQAKLIGAHNPNDTFQITIGLQLQNVKQLQRFIKQQSNPNSLNFRHYLTAQQARQLYTPTRQQISSVESFLTANGIRVEGVSATNLLIRASASVATLQKAFQVSINDYSYQGATVFSATRNPTVPMALGSLVTAVIGLDNMQTLTDHLSPSLTAAPASIAPSSRIGPSGYSPQQIATAYGWGSLTDTTRAANSTIAILTAYSYSMSDIRGFWSQYGLPPHTVTTMPVVGLTESRRLNDETTLDIERSSSMSPGSTILVYSTPVPLLSGFILALDQIVSDDQADVVSTSWGGPEANSGAELSSIEAVEDAELGLGVTQGIVFFAAAGDNGAADRTSNPDTSDYPASDPYMVAAGGTTLFLTPSNTIDAEFAWDGAGGADSQVFAQPDYQVSRLVGNGAGGTDIVNCVGDTNSTGGVSLATACGSAGAASRQSSDMALDADPGTPYSYLYNGRWALAGGTSFVAPQLAGLFAIAVTTNGGRLGFGLGANELIYCVATENAGANYAADFNDIQSGANTTDSNLLTGTFNAASFAGWDHPTGWGTPKVATTLITDLIGCVPP